MAARSRDIERTKLAYKAKVFRDKKKRSHYTVDGREFLFGVDMTKRRHEVFERDGGFCQIQSSHPVHPATNLPMPIRLGEQVGEVDHIRSRGKGGDDSLPNLRWCCPPCHRVRHNREPKWTPKGAAA